MDYRLQYVRMMAVHMSTYKRSHYCNMLHESVKQCPQASKIVIPMAKESVTNARAKIEN